MSEQVPQHEQQHALPLPEKHDLLRAKASPEKVKQAKHEAHRVKQEARKAIAELERSESQLNPVEQLEAAEKAAQPRPPLHVNRELRQITLQRELQLIRRKLSLPARSFSKVIHQPVIRAVSEGAAKTVSRPSGLLGGGLVALLGTSGYLYLANHIGFTYNYGVFLVLFVGGFAFGLILELLVHLATSSRRKPEA